MSHFKSRTAPASLERTLKNCGEGGVLVDYLSPLFACAL